ncbi:MAG: Enoyl-CoA hydratase/isomerase [Phenylobacterium sp.]|nr:Enoyl-CoA hydratase/isomerase [Phenylobacterium sp.]
MSTQVLLRRNGPVAVITINQPAKRNAFTRDMRMEMLEHLNALYGDGECRAIVLTGAERDFSSGADLSTVDENAAPWTALRTRQNFKEVHQLVRALVEGPKPVVAAVEGLAYGGGFALTLACDHVVAARTARLGGAFCRLGLMGDMGLLWTLKERVGIARAKRIMLLGEEIGGAAAAELGLVDDLVEPGEALATAEAMAARYAEVAPLSMAFTKAAYANGVHTLEDAFRAEIDYVPLLNTSNDFRAALLAFKEKRKPTFTGS